MLNYFKKKLNQKTGASLIYALLLFAICGLVGSIVLSSAVAVSGRMAEKEDMDERYYRVISAADYMANEIDGFEIGMRRKKTEEGTYELEYKVNDNYETYDSTAITDFLTQKTFSMLKSTANDAEMYSSDLYEEEVPETYNEYKLSFVGGGTEYLLDVNERSGKGAMQIILSSNISDEEDNYKVELTFIPEMKETRYFDNKTEIKDSTIT